MFSFNNCTKFIHHFGYINHYFNHCMKITNPALNLIVISTLFRTANASRISPLNHRTVSTSSTTCSAREYRWYILTPMDTNRDLNQPSTSTGSKTSIHAGHITEVHDVPMEVLIRPFPSELDENKVKSLMETIQVC